MRYRTQLVQIGTQSPQEFVSAYQSYKIRSIFWIESLRQHSEAIGYADCHDLFLRRDEVSNFSAVRFMATRLQTEVLPADESAVDEQQLVESCRLGDRDAQRQLYEQHCDKVYRLMYRMAGSSDAEDLTQHVFLCVFRKLNQFQSRSSFATWLFRLATNEALQFLRRQQRQRCRSIPHDVIDHFNESPHLDQRDLLEYALHQLDPDLGAILLLREVEDLSYYDIAMTLDIAEGTVASRLNRARRCLREIVGDAIE